MQNQGDANGDGNVDQTDYDLWQAAFGSTVPGSGGGALSGGSVPEPTSILLMLFGASAELLSRRGRSRYSHGRLSVAQYFLSNAHSRERTSKNSKKNVSIT
jgi:hypothetical protein